ncbi:uncharacterized protein involved in response to NO [Nitrosomonas eutropha]|uniref:Uncharacterized protein involved in response to NO n=1 Tax=Nitrosomonas eutropha TaxID=916 RepID=A0A1I7J6I6_9PROT|nr:NnrS family protein [Nitrosomonas eutropha]SFU80732.1 uncharacterized protein involved in response to NO [Nitrosomonas eutropha]
MAESSQIRKQQPAPQWAAFLSLGFRPLYIAGCSWAAISVALWIYAPQWLTGVLAGMFWHAHEMLWGFVATIAVGFLFTASANWTGINPLHGRALGGLTLLWIVARAGFLMPGSTAFGIAALCELLFFGIAALALGRVIYQKRSQRNYGIPLLVLGLGVADGLFLWFTQVGDYALLMESFHAGLLCMAVIALLIARRVIPFFAMRAVQGLTIPMLAGSGQWQLAASIFAIAFLLSGWASAAAVALAAAGVLALWQLFAWKPWAVRQVPLLWILYTGYAGLGIGLLVAAAYSAGWISRAAWPVHVIGVAGFAILIIGMVTRTALGHLGRPLRTDHSMVILYMLIITAAVLRLAALLPTAYVPGLLHGSSAIWILAFALYLWRFFPMLIRPRADQSPPVIKPGNIPIQPR